MSLDRLGTDAEAVEAVDLVDLVGNDRDRRRLLLVDDGRPRSRPPGKDLGRLFAPVVDSRP